MAVVRKNAGETIKIFLGKTICGPYLDMRICYQANPWDKDFEQETDRGLTLDLELLPDLVEALSWVMGAVEIKRSDRT